MFATPRGVAGFSSDLWIDPSSRSVRLVFIAPGAKYLRSCFLVIRHGMQVCAEWPTSPYAFGAPACGIDFFHCIAHEGCKRGGVRIPSHALDDLDLHILFVISTQLDPSL